MRREREEKMSRERLGFAICGTAVKPSLAARSATSLSPSVPQIAKPIHSRDKTKNKSAAPNVPPLFVYIA